MTAILAYRLFKIMFASHRGVYIKNTTWLLPKSQICFHCVDNYITFCFLQMAAILDLTHSAIAKVLSNHTTMAVDTKIMLLRPLCRKWCQFIA